MLRTSIKRFLSINPGEILQDNHGRVHDYLRISITERCNLRCTYCMPEEGIKLQTNDSYLNLEELKRISSLFVKSCGVKKIRITGGEPTIDSKLVPLMKHLNQLRESGLETMAITTNGLTLKKFSKLYKSLGLNAVNISLDTLQEVRYETVSRKRGFKLAFDGLMTALENNFDCVKLNCVVMAGFNDDEIFNFVELAHKYPLEVRFIEFMPFADNNWNSAKMLPSEEILAAVKHKYPSLERFRSDGDAKHVSKVYKTDSMLGSLGFISSISDNFCSTCNRLRVTADGHFKGCLFNKEEMSLKGLMRNGATDTEMELAIRRSLARKNKQHGGKFDEPMQILYPMKRLIVVLKGVSNILRQTMRPMVRIEDPLPVYQSGGRMSLHTSIVVRGHCEPELSHVNSEGQAKMVNVCAKRPLRRLARAEGRIIVGEQVLRKLHNLKKGDVLTVAKVAGLMGAKLTSKLIPMCHQIPLENIAIDIGVCEKSESLIVSSLVEANHKTGVEMESLTAVTITLLTLYDMCKSVNKSMIISGVRLLSKVKAEGS